MDKQIEKAVLEIEADLSARHNVGNVYRAIDPATKEQIRKRWAEIITANVLVPEHAPAQ